MPATTVATAFVAKSERMPRSTVSRKDNAPTTRPDTTAHTPNTMSPYAGEWFGEKVTTTAGTTAKMPRTTGTAQYWARSGAASRAAATATSFTSEGVPIHPTRAPDPVRPVIGGRV